MKKLSLLSFFAAFLVTAFAFTSNTEIPTHTEHQFAAMSVCSGVITASVQCVTTDPSDATITIKNMETGALAYSGPANGVDAFVTLNPGKYEISAATSGHCQFTVKWAFCGPEMANTVVVNNGSAVVGYLEIC